MISTDYSGRINGVHSAILPMRMEEERLFVLNADAKEESFTKVEFIVKL